MFRKIKLSVVSFMVLILLASCTPNDISLFQYCVAESFGSNCINQASQVIGWPLGLTLIIFSILVTGFLVGLGQEAGQVVFGYLKTILKEAISRAKGNAKAKDIRENVRLIQERISKIFSKPVRINLGQAFVLFSLILFTTFFLVLLISPSVLPPPTSTPSSTPTITNILTLPPDNTVTLTFTPTSAPTRASSSTSTTQPSPTEVPSQIPTEPPTSTPSNTPQPTNTATPSPTAISVVIINPNSKFVDSQSVGEPPHGLVFTRDGEKIIVAGRNIPIQLLNVSDLEESTPEPWALGTREPNPLGTLRSVVQVPISDTLIAGSSDKRIYIWRGGVNTKPTILATHGAQVHSLAIVENELGLILVSGGNNEIKFWSLPDGQLIRTIAYHFSTVNSLAISHDGKWLASSGDDKQTLIWGLADGKLIETLGKELLGTSQINEVAFVPNETAMVVGAGEDGRVYIWEEKEGDFLRLAGLPGFNEASLKRLVFSPDGELLVTGDVQGHLRIWDFKQRKSIALISAHEGPIISLAFSPDGRFLVTGGENDYRVRLWQIRE